MKAPRTDKRRCQLGISTLLLAMLTCGIAVAAIRRFLAVAIRPNGFAAGLMLFTIGAVVGGIVGRERGPRLMVIAASLVFTFSLINGLIEHAGEELTMWAFVCMSAGLMLGALYCDTQPEPDGEEERAKG